MNKFFGAAMLAGAAIAGTAGVAHAEGSFSGSVALTSDYVFRGISQTDNEPAIQGSLDYSNGIFYAGLWGSSVDFKGYSDYAGTMELDAYVGITPSTGPVDWDLAVIGYFYPGAQSSLDFDYMEVMVAPSIALTDSFTLGAAFFYSPEFFGDTGEAYYYEINGGFAVTDAFGLSASYGIQDVDDLGGEYANWSIGASYSLAGFDLGLTYTDTSDDAQDNWGLPENLTDGRVTFSIGRAL